MSTAWHNDAHGGSFGAVYVHMPFCAARCRYCDFPTSAIARDNALIGAYAHTLGLLIDRCATSGLLAGVRTSYIGGGTPTLAGTNLASVVARLRECAPWIEELTCEANPDSLTAPLASALATAGATRISLGIQSLDDGELTRLGRIHDAACARRACADALAAGLDLSCDLMCGIPLQDKRSWHASLEGVIQMGATHVSCYPLAIEDGTPLAAAVARGEEADVDQDFQADLMIVARDVLAAQGFSRYEVASHARPGKECIHNLAYWQGVPYLGLGSYAASMATKDLFVTCAKILDYAIHDVTVDLEVEPSSTVTVEEFLAVHPDCSRVRWRMVDAPRDLVDSVSRNRPLRVRAESLTQREAIAEDLMLSLRTTAGAPASLLAAARTTLGTEKVDAAINRAVARDLAVLDPETGALTPTDTGWLQGNALYTLMWDLA